MELLMLFPEEFYSSIENQRSSIIEHKCKITKQKREFHRKFYLTSGVCARIRKWIRGLFILSKKNPYARNILKSTAAVNYEINRQIKFYPYMIHPFCNFRIFWVIFLVTFTITALFIIPVLNAFYFELQTVWYPIPIFIDTIFLLDIILTFFTGYYDIETRTVIFDRKIVADNYVKSYFFLDLLTIFPEELVDFMISGLGNTKWYIPIFNFVKIITLRNILKGTEYLKKTFQVSSKTYEIIKLVIIISITIHWSACLEYYVPQVVLETGKSQGIHSAWIYSDTMTKTDNRIRKYIFCLQRATTALVSSSHFLPVFTLEDMLLNVALSILGRLGFIYLLFKFLEISNLCYAANKKQVKFLQQLREFMKSKELPETTQNRILAYCDYYNKRHFDREKYVLSQVTWHLRQDLIKHRCEKLFNTVALFEILPQQVKEKLAESIEPKIYLPNDEIVKLNTPGDSLFYIVSGTVAIYSNKGKEICHLEDDCYFGEIALVMENEFRIASVYAVETSEIFVLIRDDFIRVISGYPSLLNRLQKLALQRLKFTFLSGESNTEEDLFPKSVNISNVIESQRLFS